MRNINRILGRNRRILAELNREKKYQITKDILIGKGFDFNYFTGICKTEEGDWYYFVYELGFCFSDNFNIAVIEKSEIEEALTIPLL